jgi:cyclopropane-fatty-acyl-phospholipid synthase
MLLPPSHLSLAEAYVRGDFDVEGDMEAAAVLATQRDAAAVRYHYDLGNDFYALWLGRQMVYSCAYFPTGEESLDESGTMGYTRSASP